MRISQADIPLGSLLNRNNVEGEKGETRVVLRIFPNDNPFNMFNWLISEFIVNNRKINFECYAKVFTDCQNSFIENPEKNKSKRKLFLIVSKFPWSTIFSDPDMLRWYILSIHTEENPIYYSYRALGSERFEYYRKNFRLELRKLPGKSDFPEPSYIGVGYRDKGNSREESHDGSPSWQELSNANLEDEERIKLLEDRHIRKMLNFDENFLISINRRLRKFRRDYRQTVLGRYSF